MPMLSSHPRLTIGIPTQGKRPALLSRAVRSALGQMLPARILIADQSGDDSVENAIGGYLQNPLVKIVKTHENARCLWENWRLAAEFSDCEFFAWLQDDDVLAPHFSRRIVGSFDVFPNASVWIARLAVSHDGVNALPNQGSGPMVPMDLLFGTPREVHGGMLAACAHYTTFALSPGVAFRWNTQSLEALKRCPHNSDLFVERSVLAELGTLGNAICDPALVGYWCHHGENESRRIMADGKLEEQAKAFFDHIDPIIAATEGWQEYLKSWGILAGTGMAKHHLEDVQQFAHLSSMLPASMAVLQGVLDGMTKAGKDEPAPPTRKPEPETTVSKRNRKAERAVTR